MRKLSGISLQTKIIAGYLILLAVIGSMIAILLHERKKMHDIANGTAEIREIRNEVNAIRRHIVGIALLGESAIGWDSEDFSAYQNRRLHIDSLLERMKDNGLDLVSHEQIDTLRRLLEEKESRLYHLTTVFQDGLPILTGLRLYQTMYQPPVYRYLSFLPSLIIVLNKMRHVYFH